MNPLDVIIADGVRSVLEGDLGRVTYRNVEREVRGMYGLSVREAAGDFAKLDLVLRKFFGRHAANVESKAFRKIMSLEKRGGGGGATLNITHDTVTRYVLESYGDPAKRAILDMMRRPMTVPDVISASGLPKASTYSRIRDLLNGGLLAAAGHAEASDGRSVKEFSSTLRKVTFDVRDSWIGVSAGLDGAILSKSFAFNSIVQTRAKRSK